MNYCGTWLSQETLCICCTRHLSYETLCIIAAPSILLAYSLCTTATPGILYYCQTQHFLSYSCVYLLHWAFFSRTNQVTLWACAGFVSILDWKP